MNPIGVFDSGYGGLTVLKELVHTLPQYDYFYLGDNARAPYGPRSYHDVYAYTLQAVQWFFEQGCPLVILACNTASAKALRSIQQNDLPSLGKDKRVLGVIRPTAEVIGNFTSSRHIGLFGTEGTVQSGSYLLEIQKTFPDIQVTQEACPMWVTLVENNEHNLPGSAYLIEKHVEHLLKQDPSIDAILLACTHYPLLENAIHQYLPNNVQLISQGALTASALQDYLKRHSAMEAALSKGENRLFFTTGEPAHFNHMATMFYGQSVEAQKITLG